MKGQKNEGFKAFTRKETCLSVDETNIGGFSNFSIFLVFTARGKKVGRLRYLDLGNHFFSQGQSNKT